MSTCEAKADIWWGQFPTRNAVEFMSQMEALSRLFVQGEWRCCNRGTQLGSTTWPATPAEKGADLMLRWFLQRQIAAFERTWNYDAGYIHEVIDVDPRA